MIFETFCGYFYFLRKKSAKNSGFYKKTIIIARNCNRGKGR
nr:MAG TPA: hypothetical protein [Caudoviricetes sp.]